MREKARESDKGRREIQRVGKICRTSLVFRVHPLFFPFLLSVSSHRLAAATPSCHRSNSARETGELTASPGDRHDACLQRCHYRRRDGLGRLRRQSLLCIPSRCPKNWSDAVFFSFLPFASWDSLRRVVASLVAYIQWAELVVAPRSLVRRTHSTFTTDALTPAQRSRRRRLRSRLFHDHHQRRRSQHWSQRVTLSLPLCSPHSHPLSLIDPPRKPLRNFRRVNLKLTTSSTLSD